MSETENGRIGSSFDDFLDEEGIHEEVAAQALKEVLAWQIEQEMKAAGLTKTAMARRLVHQPRPTRPPARPRQHLGDAAHPAEGGLGRGPAVTA